MGVKEDCKEVVKTVFGPVSAAKLDGFSDEPEECVKKSIAFLATMIGEEKAKNKFQSLIEKYHIVL